MKTIMEGPNFALTMQKTNQPLCQGKLSRFDHLIGHLGSFFFVNFTIYFGQPLCLIQKISA
jgi:hypothetical protein